MHADLSKSRLRPGPRGGVALPLPAGRRQRPRPGDHLAAARGRPRALPPVGPRPSWSPTPRSARPCRSPRPAASWPCPSSGDLELTQGTGEHLQTLALTKGTAEIPCTSRSRRSSSRSASRRSAPGRRPTTSSPRSSRARSRRRSTSASTTPRTPSTGSRSTELTLTGTVAELADGIQADDVTRRRRRTPTEADLLKALNFEPDNPTSLFGGVREAFKSAGSDLTTMTGGGLDVPIPFVGLLGQPADRCRCQRRRGRDVRTGRRNGGRPRHGQRPGGGRRPRDDHADRRRADLHPCVHRPPDRGRLDHRHHRRPGRAHPHPGPAARLRAGRRHAVPRGERAPRCRPRAARASTPATLQETLAMAQASLGQRLDHRLRPGRRTAAPSCAST